MPLLFLISQKNILSISKLTNAQPVDFLLSKHFFAIQHRITKDIITWGRVDCGFYIPEQGHEAFLASLSKPSVSFERWHACLGHVVFDVITFMSKIGCLYATSLLPKPHICTSC